MSDADRSELDAVLDAIIPATEALAGAGGLGLGGAVLEDASRMGTITTLGEVLAGLPSDFTSLEQHGREDVLRELEARDPAAIRMIVNLVYTAYYTDPRVLAEIQAATGYNAGPPQPQGYHLEPFGEIDEALLAPVRAMQPIWRRVP
jgi:hypothetical protein